MDELSKLRRQIDRIDQVIVTALGERMELMQPITKVKKEQNVPVFAEKRDREVLSHATEFAKQYHLDQRFVQSVYKLIFEESKRLQQKYLEEMD